MPVANVTSDGFHLGAYTQRQQDRSHQTPTSPLPNPYLTPTTPRPHSQDTPAYVTHAYHPRAPPLPHAPTTPIPRPYHHP